MLVLPRVMMRTSSTALEVLNETASVRAPTSLAKSPLPLTLSSRPDVRFGYVTEAARSWCDAVAVSVFEMIWTPTMSEVNPIVAVRSIFGGWPMGSECSR